MLVVGGALGVGGRVPEHLLALRSKRKKEGPSKGASIVVLLEWA